MRFNVLPSFRRVVFCATLGATVAVSNVCSSPAVAADAPPPAPVSASANPLNEVSTLIFGNRRGGDVAPFTEADFAKIEATPTRILLLVSNSDIDDADLERLAENPRISQINLANCPNLTEAAVEKLARFPRLESVLIGSAPRWENPNFAALNQCKTLRRLSLRNCDALSQESLNGIAQCVGLRGLQIYRCPVSDANLENFAKLPELMSVELRGCPEIGDDGIGALANLPQLQILLTKGLPKVSDVGVARLAKASRLFSLELDDCPLVTEKGLEALTALPIRILNAPEQMFCDEKIDVFTKFPQLEYLYVEQAKDAPLSDANLLKLKEIKGLKLLHCRSARTVSEAGFEALQRELPQCKIFHYDVETRNGRPVPRRP